MKILNIVILVMIVALISCNSSEDEMPDLTADLVQITSFEENDLHLTVYAPEALFVGYNTVTVKITDNSDTSLSGDISVLPIMDMSTMSHSCPVEVSDDNFIDGLFTFNAVFLMPSGEMGSWEIKFTINEVQISVPIEVVAPELTRLVSFTSSMDVGTKYFVAYIDPKDPEVGKNDLEIAVYKKETMMSWPAVTNLNFEVEPWMVSMDHGSPNNVAPVHAEKGHYKGTVNFTMTGDWQIRLTMKEGKEICGTPYFDLYFQ
ncbi:MAG: FixH family protein [Bacteroidota bacterium]